MFLMFEKLIMKPSPVAAEFAQGGAE